jgi:hypothetical protein
MRRNRRPLKRHFSTIRISLSCFAVFALCGCDKEPHGKPDVQRTEPSNRTATDPVANTGVGPLMDTAKELDKFGPFPEKEDGNGYLIPWEDITTFVANPLPEDSAKALTQAFRSSLWGHDSIIYDGPDFDSIRKFFSENLDFRECGGSGNFSTLDKGKMEKDLVFGSAPKKGFTYRILGKWGELVREPLRFDSMQANIFVNRDDTTYRSPLWRAFSGIPAIDEAIGSLQGTAFVLGSKTPLLNSAVKPVPISDSLKLFILKSILPDESMLRLFSGFDFYSAGGNESGKRCVIRFNAGEYGRGYHHFVVEVADGKCTVLFRVNSYETTSLQWFLSLTESPIADVFVFRVYETLLAFMKKDGKWVGMGFEYNDFLNWGC